MNISDLEMPRSMAEISSKWLTATLRSTYPGVEVTQTEIIDFSEGTSTRVRLSLSYNDIGQKNPLPRRMCFKSGFAPYSDAIADMYRREVFFYRDLAAQLSVNRPKVYYADVDDTGRAGMLMEDLNDRQARFPGGNFMLTPMQAMAALDQLARLHARFWNSPELASYPWLHGPKPHIWAMKEFSEPEYWRACMETERCAALPAEYRDGAKIREAFKRMVALGAGAPQCLIHGDAHLGNTFIEGESEVGLLDWQLCMSGHWAHDFAEFFTTAMSIEDRRRTERDMMLHYLDRLNAYGASAPTFDEAWLAYRQHIIYTITWFIVPTHMQTLQVQRSNAERWLAAALDASALESLGL